MAYEQFKGYEVSGEAVAGYVAAFRSFKLLASKYLLAEGIGTRDATGQVEVDANTWYPLDRFLSAFSRIAAEAGDRVLHQIGVGVGSKVPFAPGQKDFHSLITLINAGYHINHRKDGVVMFDPQTGKILEGIGDFIPKKLDDQGHEWAVEVANPYPCAFDEGIITAMARVVNAVAEVRHDPNSPCRKRGEDRCRYLIRNVSR